MHGTDPRPSADPWLSLKLTLLAVVPILLALGLIYGLLWNAADAVVRDLVVSDAGAALERESAPFEALFERAFCELELLAADPELPGSTPAEVTSWLGAVRGALGIPVEELYHNDLEGNVRSSAGVRFNVRDRYYYEAMVRGERVVTRAILSRDTGVPIVLVLTPYYAPDGTQLGALGATLRLSALFEGIRELRVGERGFALLHDERDFAVSSFAGEEPSSPRGPLDPLPSAHPLREIVDAEGLGLEPRRIVVAGTPYLVSTRDLAHTPWRLSLCADEAEALAPLRTLRQLSLSVVIALALVSALCVLGTRRLLSRPLLALGEETRRAELEAELLEALSGSGTSAQQLAAALTALRGSLEADAVEVWIDGEGGRLERAATSDRGAAVHGEAVGATVMPLPGRRGQVRVIRSVALSPTEERRLSGARLALALWISRERTEAELERSELRYRRVLESDLVGVLTWTGGGEIEDANDALLGMLGYTREELEAGELRWDELTPPRWADLDRLGLEQIQTRGSCDPFQKEYLHKDGHPVPVVIRGASFDASGSTGVAFVLDMSAHKAAEREREALEAQLREARHLEALGTLASGIAHDFNNLLTVILGGTLLVLDSEQELGAQRAHLDHVVGAARRAAQLVRQVLAFGRQGSKQVSPVPLAPLLEDVLRLQDPPGPGVEVTLALETDCPPALCDPGQLHQVLMNLVGNALFALREAGGGTLTIRARGEGDADERVVLEVEDDGPGIPEEVLPRIFEPFFSTKGSEGTGLGLSVVHGIVLSHGGSVRVDSSPGRGATFRLELPAAEEAPPPVVAPPATPAPPRSPERPLRCMLVDDEPIVRRVTRHHLEGAGWEVVEFQDPERALAAFAEDPTPYDLVLTDLSMPQLDGLELARRVHGLAPAVPVCLLSGWTAPVEGVDLEAHGIRAVISKPFTGADLLDSVRRSVDPDA
ncbi:MAG: ATP-binding protein [Planctomycetota bacterium]